MSAMQPQLPLPVTPQRRRSAKGSKLYDAIQTLRRAWVSVHAEGTRHRVNGRLLTDSQLMRWARQYAATVAT